MAYRDKRLNLLRQCLEKLTTNQFEDLIASMLPPPEQDYLDKPVSKVKFLENIERWRYLDKLEEKLREKWSDLLSDSLHQLEELRKGVVIEEPKEKRVISVDFVNRIVELNQAFQSTSLTQYWIIDAPAGYGKTKFLQEVRRLYGTQGWICCYVEIHREAPPKIHALANEIMSELGCPERLRPMGTRQIGRQISASLLGLRVGVEQKTFLSQAQYLGVSILLDNVEALDDHTLSELAELIAGVFEGLKNGGFFDMRNKFRCFLAGRNARRRASILRRDVYVAEQALSTYSFPVVQDTVQQYALKAGVVLPEENLPEIAAHLMYLTGGHPGCIAAILGELAEGRFAETRTFLQDQPQDFLKRIVFPVVEELENGSSDVAELVPVVETLSVFRRYSPWLLQALIDKGHIQWDGDEYQLESALMETYLLDRKDGFLQDDITRRLFAIRLRSKEPPRFQMLCREGLALYEDYLHSSKLRRPEIVAVEWLYQKLQCEYYAEGKRGNLLKQEIMKAAEDVLDMLVPTWDYRDIIPDFIDALNQDWEFEFFVNFFLSENGYNHDPYRELVKQVEEKFQRLVGGSRMDENVGSISR